MSDLIERLREFENGYFGPAWSVYSEAAAEIERLQRIIDSRPAINAGLPQTYIDWSRGIYECDVLQACHAPKD